MIIVNGRKVRNANSSFIPTCVKGIRAEVGFWAKCDDYAKKVGMSRNELFLIAVNDYIERNKK